MRLRFTWAFALLIIFNGLVGCGVRYDPAVIDAERFTRNSPYLTFNTPVVTQAQITGTVPATGAAMPWWQIRNEYVPSVAAGFESTDIRDLHLRIRDRQRTTNGQPNDSYLRNIRIHQSRRTTR